MRAGSEGLIGLGAAERGLVGRLDDVDVVDRVDGVAVRGELIVVRDEVALE